MRIFTFARRLWVIPLFFVLAAAFLTAAPTQAQVNATALVASPALNVREGPGLGYSVTTIVYQNQVLTLLARNSPNTWVKIRTAGTPREGWVSLALIQTSANIGALPVIDVPTFQNTAVVNTGRANIRKGDTLEYAVITNVVLGETITLLGRNGNGSWVQVRTFGGVVGWMNAAELTPNQTVISTLAVLPVPLLTDENRDRSGDPPGGNIAVVASGFLNVRRGPGVGYGILTSLLRNQQIPLVARTADQSWAVVQLPSGQQGWVNASYLIYTLDISTLPIISNVPPPSSNSTNLPPTTPATPAADPAPTGNAYVTSALNVRSGPGVGFTRVALVFGGENLSMTGRNADGSWIKVRLSGGQAGWVSAGFIIPSVSVTSLPVTN